MECPTPLHQWMCCFGINVAALNPYFVCNVMGLWKIFGGKICVCSCPFREDVEREK
jgi:hypothetical protein